ncbi:olfactory receptor 707 (predicted) [Rattus norvegicus]|uniref:Olfactory receptor 707 (Predicted) n=1 Tax=Rattus norvegicus TaxID=10116 RepID=A6HN43_RAT|nr:olfactory receptor 707 (predicted) [Rattus norvegicus]
MGENNNITEFILLGLTQDPDGRKALFVIFFLIYIVTMVGNLLIVVTVIASPSLGSPMYFFLASLSLLDALLATAISPKLIADLLYDQKTISFRACMSQLFIEHLFGGVDIVILVAMAYDRYVASVSPALLGHHESKGLHHFVDICLDWRFYTLSDSNCLCLQPSFLWP